MKTKTINNPIENVVDRDEVVWNHNAGALVFDNTTGKQRVHMTHKSGANWYMNDKVVSTFSLNDLQELARGNVYKTATGDTFIQSQKNTELSNTKFRSSLQKHTFFKLNSKKKTMPIKNYKNSFKSSKEQTSFYCIN